MFRAGAVSLRPRVVDRHELLQTTSGGTSSIVPCCSREGGHTSEGGVGACVGFCRLFFGPVFFSDSFLQVRQHVAKSLLLHTSSF